MQIERRWCRWSGPPVRTCPGCRCCGRNGQAAGPGQVGRRGLAQAAGAVAKSSRAAPPSTCRGARVSEEGGERDRRHRGLDVGLLRPIRW